MHEIPILINIGVALAAALVGGLLARQARVPPLVGDLVAGMAIGPFTPGFVGEASIVLGLAISIASTVVLLRGLMDEGFLGSRHGRIAVGWLALEDLATVLLLLIRPALASGPTGVESPPLGLTLIKAAVFIALMLLLGARVIVDGAA
jgi:CPA2 family monovalent cation:H+ antiporter-2